MAGVRATRLMATARLRLVDLVGLGLGLGLLGLVLGLRLVLA